MPAIWLLYENYFLKASVAKIALTDRIAVNTSDWKKEIQKSECSIFHPVYNRIGFHIMSDFIKEMEISSR